jgi:hypothetical protein
MEVWKDIVDFPNYQVSNLGNVKSLKRKMILKPRAFKKKGDYVCYEVHLYNDTQALGFHQKIHRLVAEAFIPRVEGKTEVDHIDQNPANNHVDNLRWSNRSENCLNTKIRSDNTSGHKNIYWVESRKVFQVKLFRDNKEIYVGAFKTLEEAIKARDEYLLR